MTILWPVVRPLGNRALRQRWPIAWLGLAGGVLGWILGVTWMTVSHSGWLHGLAVVTVGLSLLVFWRFRSGFGSQQGLPPGSLSIGDSLAALTDRDFYRDRFERLGPIFKMAQFHQPVICVLGLRRGQELFREQVNSLDPASQGFSRDLAGGFLRYMEPRVYGIYGPLFRAALGAEVSESAEPDARAAARRVFDRMAAASPESGDQGVLLVPHLHEIAFVALLKALLGVLPDSQLGRQMKRPFEVVLAHPLGRPLDKAAAEAVGELRALIATIPIGRPEGDGASALARLHHQDPRMPDEVCVDNLIFMIKVGHPNLVGLMTWTVKRLGEDQHWRDRLKSFSPGPGRPDLSEWVVLETLRISQSEYRYRGVKETFVFEGHTFPRGWLIRHCVAESHRDPAVFESPDDFDPERFRRSFTLAEYAPFGAHQHACNAVDLSLMTCKVAIEELCRGYDWQISNDGPLVREFRHWSHWRPTDGLRIRLSAARNPG